MALEDLFTSVLGVDSLNALAQRLQRLQSQRLGTLGQGVSSLGSRGLQNVFEPQRRQGDLVWYQEQLRLMQQHQEYLRLMQQQTRFPNGLVPVKEEKESSEITWLRKRVDEISWKL